MNRKNTAASSILKRWRVSGVHKFWNNTKHMYILYEKNIHICINVSVKSSGMYSYHHFLKCLKISPSLCH